MILAKDVMTSNVITVTPTTPVIEAVNLLIDSKVSGLPVVDDDNYLKGVITEKDLLGLLIDIGLAKTSNVEEFMSKKVASFKEDDNVVLICEFFINNNFRRVPIVKDKKLTGVISRRDIIKLVLDEREKMDKEAAA